MRAKLGIAIAAVLALAACEQPVAEAEAEAEPAAPVGADPIDAATKASVQMNGSGIVVPAQNGDEQLEVPFGSMREAAETSLAAVLGEQTGTNTLEECPMGPASTSAYADMILTFQDDRFVGWMAEGQYLPTETLGEFQAQDGVTAVEDSTLGAEYTMGTDDGPIITVLFDGDGDEARADKMWAGSICIFR